MNSIEMLTHQHREVDRLFHEIEEADEDEQQALFDQIADQLAIHTAIEEHQFYPEVRRNRTEDILLESLEEHLVVKRALADLLNLSPGDETWEAKLKVLQELVEHHVKEEEEQLFPKVRKLFGGKKLEEIGAAMLEEAERLKKAGEPRRAIPSQTTEAAPLSP